MSETGPRTVFENNENARRQLHSECRICYRSFQQLFSECGSLIATNIPSFASGLDIWRYAGRLGVVGGGVSQDVSRPHRQSASCLFPALCSSSAPLSVIVDILRWWRSLSCDYLCIMPLPLHVHSNCYHFLIRLTLPCSIHL